MAFQDFDQITQRRQHHRRQRLRRRITIAVSIVVLLLLAASAVGIVTYKHNHQDEVNSHQQKNESPPAQKQINAVEKEVKMVCAATDYKKTCQESLLKAVEKNSSAEPKDILRSSFAVASEEINKVIKNASGFKFDTPLKRAALDDCLVLLNDAIEELNSSISSIEGSDLAKISSRRHDINNWLSAVLSYQQTCIDGSLRDGKRPPWRSC